MGNYAIRIRGLGAHHNNGNAGDADRRAAELVRVLQDSGHEVSEATFTYDRGEDDLKAAAALLRQSSESEERPADGDGSDGGDGDGPI